MGFKFEEKVLLTLSTGMMAGLGSTLTLVAVPAMLKSADPTPVWKTVYNNGKNIAFSCITVSSIVSLRRFWRSEDWRYLLVFGLTSAIVPYTLLFMKGTNDSLAAIEGKGKERRGKDEGKELVEKWGRLQLGRTLLSLGAFITTVMIVIPKRCAEKLL